METFFIVLIALFLYAGFIFSYKFPKEALLLFSRWEYAEEPVFSEFRLRLNKFLSIVGISFTSIIVMTWFVDSMAIRMLFVLAAIITMFIAFVRLMDGKL